MQNEFDQKNGIQHTTWSLAVTHKLVLNSSQNNPPGMQSLFPLGRTDQKKTQEYQKQHELGKRHHHQDSY